MTPVTWAIAGGVLLAVLFFVLKPSSLGGHTNKAIATKDLDPLVQHLAKIQGDTCPTAFNQAVKQMWDSYERPLAVDLIKSCANFVSSSSIGQYWIRQVLEVEPELAEESFDSDFLATYYNPEVAMQCGKVG